MHKDITTKTMGIRRDGKASLATVLLLVLAILPARSVRAQTYQAVAREALLERFHRDLSDALDNPSHIVNIEPGSIRLSYPESTDMLPKTLFIAGAIMLIVPTVYSVALTTTALSLGSIVKPVMVTGATFILPSAFFLRLTDAAQRAWLETVEDVDNLIQSNPSSYLSLTDFLYNRMELHYELSDWAGESEDGSCLVFFALRENPGEGHDLHYALDACSHGEAFPQTVPMETGDARIDSDGVDAWDELLGQDMVVAKGSIRLPPPERRPLPGAGAP